MFCSTVSEGSRLKAWKMNPIRSRRSSVRRVAFSFESSVAPIETRPSLGRSSPAATCRSVLLPEPEGPITAVNVPDASETETPRKARTALPPLP
jgi:hypothetical protein